MKKKILIFGLIIVTLVGVVAPSFVAWWSVETVKAMEEGEEENEEIEMIVLPDIYIKAVNPGYKIDGVNNVGEMIEIARNESSDTPILLAGLAVSYTNSSGNTSVIMEFPENSFLTGESILLRLASSPSAELANAMYEKTLAMKGEISLEMDGEIIDEACWTGKTGCSKVFNSVNPTTLVRNLKTGEFEHVLEYEPGYKTENYFVEKVEEEEVKLVSQCKGLEFSEILSYYESAKTEQFIEIYNASNRKINLDGCRLRYKNKNYLLSGTLEADKYLVYYPTGFSLTKNPTSSNKLEIIDTDEAVVDILEYPNGQRKGTSYAFLGYDEKGKEIWKVTYAPTPGEPNNYQEFKTCAEGKVINKVTGNCVKVTSVSEKVCKEGYYLNILTGRCKKKTIAKTKTCKEGYYLNPETNRCRKIKENKGANYSMQPENYEESSSFVALYAVLGVLGVGLIYLIYEFRHEIWKLLGRVFRLSR